jgi:hypothetical protein
MDRIQNNTSNEEGIRTISVEIDRGKREIQGDKDCHLQLFTNEKTRIIQQIQTEAYEAMQRIEKATAKTLANIQTTRRIQPPLHNQENTPRTNGDTHHNNGRKTHIRRTQIVPLDMAHKTTHHSSSDLRTITMTIQCDLNIDSKSE